MGPDKSGVNKKTVNSIAFDIKSVLALNTQICIVIGGGNIFRGMSVAAKGMNRVTADYMGMLATIMNSVALQSELEKIQCDTRVMSALSITQLAEPYIKRRASRHLEKGRIVIFAGGTGNPYFTTDTAAVLRGIETDVDIIIKATKVDGIYSTDPLKDENAVKYDELSFKDVIDKELKIMDMTAFTLCKENNLPIAVMSINDNSLIDFINNKKIGTIVK